MRWRVAIHEAGHAIVAAATSGTRPHLLTIENDGGGMHARAAQSAHTRAALETRIAISLAGHAAETLILDAPSGGSGGNDQSDLAMATKIAAMIEDSLGLGETLLYLSPDDWAKDRLRFDPAQRKLIEGHLIRNHERATRILKANRAQLMALASSLDAEGILRGDALTQLLSTVIPEQPANMGDFAPGTPSNLAQGHSGTACLISDASPSSRAAADACPDTGRLHPETCPDAGEGATSDPTRARPQM